MSKKDIRNMSVEEIKRKIGELIYPDQMMYVLTDAAYDDKIIKQMDEEVFDTSEMYQFIEENPDKIDKERLIFIIAVNMRDYIERLSTKHIQDIAERMTFEKVKSQYEFAKKVLDGSDVELPLISERKGSSTIEGFMTVNDLDRTRKSPKNKENLRQKNGEILQGLKNEGFIKTIANFSNLHDFEDYLCYYRGNGKFFEYIIKKNASEKFLSTPIKDWSDDEKYKNLADYYEIEFLKALEKHCDKFDMEKLLLMSAYRSKDILENYSGLSLEKEQEYIKIMNYASKHIENKRRKISADVYLDTMADRTHIEYSYKQLQKDLSRVVDGTDGKYYFSENFLKETKESVLDGRVEFQKVNFVGLFQLLNFNFAEKTRLVELNPDNFEYLLVLNSLDDTEIHQMIDHGLGDYKVKHICLYDNQLIEKSDIIKMYMKHHIDLSQIFDFAEMYPNLETEISISNLMQYYEDMKQDPEKTTDFERYALLFKEFRLNRKEPNTQDEIAGEIAMQICEADSEYDDFKNLYKFNLLPIQTLIEWNGEEIIYDLISNGALKPRDTKDLLVAGKLNLEKACHTLKNSSLSEEEKLNFIFSSFNGVGKSEQEIKAQNDARMYLIQALNVSNEIAPMQKNNKATRTKTELETNEKSEGNRYISDPVYRWQLFSELDVDCEIELYLDGTAKVSLPNLNKIIIEKLFKSTKNGTRINYGAATYIMNQEEFYKHKEKIVQDKKVNRKVLVEMGEKGIADRIIHFSKWGKSLKENLEIVQENGYSKDKIGRIDALVNKIEKARELMD